MEQSIDFHYCMEKIDPCKNYLSVSLKRSLGNTDSKLFNLHYTGNIRCNYLLNVTLKNKVRFINYYTPQDAVIIIFRCQYKSTHGRSKLLNRFIIYYYAGIT